MALPQLNQLSLCTTKVLVPTGNQTIEDRFSTGGPNYREFFYAAQQLRRVEPELRRQRALPADPGRRRQPTARTSPTRTGEDSPLTRPDFAHAIEPPLGIQPQLGGQPPNKPGVRCDTNPVPDVNGPLGQVGPA